ncbi:helix-turn-helix domain-containing protein [Streptomyces sp. NPDC059850]|uniref:helix-turn-helix domain-containing protein n=1 Tax=Streptomyces sp. NPDC059850 TaxID=3346970 RepID=UPI003647922F
MSEGAAAAEDNGNQLPLPRVLLPHVQWHWATPQAESVLRCGDLGAVLRFHRQIHGLSQTTLGNLLGYDKTYISMVENGRRTIDDVPSRRRIAATLRLPPHVLGVTDPTDADHVAMLQFGDSTVRLTEIARQSGHAREAVAELWPLVARLEGRVADGHTEREVLVLLARARVGLGVALGHVLPEERLPVAARWTGQGLAVARHLGDPAMTSYALRMHGNELRKARLIGAAVDRLRHAVAIAPGDAERAAALTLLARAAGELGDGELFDEALRGNRGLLEQVAHTSLVNPFALHEIQLRGLLKTGRAERAVRLIDSQPPASYAVTPQWRVIEHITAGSVLLRRGDPTGADERLSAAVTDATAHRLPHQLQRVIRATRHALPATRERAEQGLQRLRQDMAA